MQSAHNIERAWAFSIFSDSDKTQKALETNALGVDHGLGLAKFPVIGNNPADKGGDGCKWFCLCVGFGRDGMLRGHQISP